MIVSIEGRLEKATPLSAVINAGGLGYLVHVPVSTAARLPAIGENVKLHTQAIYREDSQALYGFATEDERDFFALVIDKVSGVGPKVAIGMMSKLDLGALVTAIASEDVNLLAKTPGIGKKTAERVVIELKDKLLAFKSAAPLGALPTPPAASLGPQAAQAEDAILALAALGYKPADAKKQVQKALDHLGKNATTEQLIKAALA